MSRIVIEIHGDNKPLVTSKPVGAEVVIIDWRDAAFDGKTGPTVHVYSSTADIENLPPTAEQWLKPIR